MADQLTGLLGGIIDPDELQKIMQMFAPTIEDKTAAQKQAMITAGLRMLGARKGREGIAAGEAGLMGLDAYNGTMAGAAQQRKDAFSMQNHLLDYANKRQGFQDEQTARQVMANFKPPAQTMQPGSAVANPASVGVAPQSGQYERIMALADAFEAKGLAKKAMEYRALAEKYAPQYDGTETLIQNGQPVVVQRFKNRPAETMTGYQPKPDIQIQNLGGRDVAIDKLRVRPGQEFVRSVGPDTVYSGDIAMRGQDLTNARARESNAISQGNNARSVTTDLRKEFNSLEPVKAFGQVMPALQSAREATQQDTAAADLNIIYAAAKIFDPTSVVRESETTMVMNSGSPAQRFAGQFNYVAGGGRLTTEARKQLMQQIESRARGYEAPYKSARKTYEAVAVKNGVDPKDVFVEPSVTSEQKNPLSGKAVLRTGTEKGTGRKVIQYSDGSMGYQ